MRGSPTSEPRSHYPDPAQKYNRVAKEKKSRFFCVFIFSIAFIFFPAFSRHKDTVICREAVFAGSILESEQKLYSWHDEELIIRDFFSDRKDGIFVDVGCAHFKDSSNTYYLEKHLGWSGIAVDSLAEFALGYIENRPGTRFFNFIVTDHSKTIEPFYRQKQIKARVTSSTSEQFVVNAAERKNVTPDYQIVYVPTITLTELLDANGISTIDFLSLDIELGEVRALKSFDIERFKPKLVCVEVLNQEQKKQTLAYFKEHGYELIEKYLDYDSFNWYFRQKIK